MATRGSAPLNKPASQYEVSSLRKALEILSAFTLKNPNWTLSGLSRALGIPKSTAHNLISTLMSFDYVGQAADKHFTLGPKIYALGLVYSQSTELLTTALPILRRLSMETRETVKLGVLSERQVLVLAAIESSYQLHTRADVGGRWPLHSTSLGKAILAMLPPTEVRELIARHRLPALTPRTITTLKKLEPALAEIRERGYALDWEENEPGVHCVAVGIPDLPAHTIAALSISGPSLRITEQTVDGLARMAKHAAHSISEELAQGVLPAERRTPVERSADVLAKRRGTQG
jgi:IclR family acetate operon transcriptional repressor